MSTRILRFSTKACVCALFFVLLALVAPYAAFANEAPGADTNFALTPSSNLVAQEATQVDSGTWGTCPWVLTDDGVLKVSPGTAGAINDAPWKAHGNETERIVFLKDGGAKVIAPENCRQLFDGARLAESIDLTGLDTSNSTSLANMFYGCRSLKSLDLSPLDTGNATSMYYMFAYCASLESLDLSPLNTSKVTNMSGMFEYCTGLKSIDINGIDMSSVKEMFAMFANCTSLPSISITDVDTSNVTNMFSLFSYCGNLRNVDLSGLDTQNVTHMSGMFDHCGALTSLDLSSFDLSKLTYAGNMFSNCWNLQSIKFPQSSTPNLTSMEGTFLYCTSLKSLDLSNFTTENVTTMQSAFFNCMRMTDINISSFDTSNVTNMYGMFFNCQALTKLDLSNFNTAKVTNMGSMLNSLTSLQDLDISSFDMTHIPQNSNVISACPKLERVRVGTGFQNIASFPSHELFGHTDWYSKTADQWFTASDITTSRFNIADTYTKWTYDIAGATVDIPDQHYTGSPLEPKPTVKMGNLPLAEGADYQILGYEDNVEISDNAKIRLKGIEEFSGTGTFNFTIAPPKPIWTRFYGKTRYSTMGLIANEAFPEGSSWAIVVSGEDKNFPDALSASALAGVSNCPIITTSPASLNQQAAYLLDSMGVEHVIIVGGNNAVSQKAEGQIRTIVGPSGTVERIAGKTRYATSQLVLEAVAEAQTPQTAFVATGTEFADALSAGPWSFANGAPIVLVNPKTGPTDSQIAAIASAGVKHVVVLGGKNAVPLNTESRLEAAGLMAERVAGNTRYSTSTSLARWSMQNGQALGATNPILATGMKSADALAGAALAGKKNSVIVLADEKDAKGKARYMDAFAFLTQESEQLSAGYFLGGPKAVAQELAMRIVNATDAEYREVYLN